MGRQGMDTFLRVSTIAFWAIAIGVEYAVQWLPNKKRLLNFVAAVAFAVAPVVRDSRSFFLARAISSKVSAELRITSLHRKNNSLGC